jgi:hypothetical protein
MRPFTRLCLQSNTLGRVERKVQSDSKLLSGGFMDYNFQTGNNMIKQLTEYEIITQNVLLFVESILQNTKLQQARLSSIFILLFPVLKLCTEKN